MKKIVVLLSGQGANLQALIDACQRGAIDGKIAAVISNRADAYGLIRAREADIPTALFERSNYSDNQAMDKAIGDFIAEIGADLIVLAGYMRILSQLFVERFAGRILNIHSQALRASSPKGGAFDKTANFAWIAKASPFGRGGIAKQ